MNLLGQAANLSGISMKDLLAKVNFDLPKVGQILEGEVVSASKNSVILDLGPLGTGIIYPVEFYDNPNSQRIIKTGQKISAVLLDLENENGQRELSLKRAQMTTAWQDIKNKKESGEVITAPVANINKGGLIVEIDGIQGFLPLSQLSPEHYPKIEGGDTSKIVQVLQKLRNQEIQVKIIDFLEEENRLIVSEKAINDGQLKEELAKFNVGDVIEGEVTDVTDFGAFVKISESIEALIHISEIDWKLIDDPRNFLASGQKVTAKIIAIDGSKISLSLKALKEDPWIRVEEIYAIGQVLDGEVAKITNHGVLVKMDEQIAGLIPFSEFEGSKPSDFLKAGDKLTVAIVSIDPKEHKMILTLQDRSVLEPIKDPKK